MLSGKIKGMKTENLLKTNPYLRDPARLERLLATTVCTSSAIEGVIFTVEETLTGKRRTHTVRPHLRSAVSSAARG
jgi:hypothetical protein